jgi:pilus assembly protein Flp/PilA
MLLKDTSTGTLRQVNLGPFSLEAILRSPRRDRPMIGGLIVEALTAEACEMAPDFAPVERRHLDEPRMTVVLEQAIPARPKGWLPAWRRRRSDNGQGLVEYALVLALIAVIAVIALIYIGTQVSAALSDVGNSI